MVLSIAIGWRERARRSRVDLLVDLGDGRVEGVDWSQMQAQQEAMVSGHPALQRRLQFSGERFDPPMRQRRQAWRIGLAGDQGLDDAAAADGP